MTHVDGLSRCNFVTVIRENLFEANFMIAQNLDEEINKIKLQLEKAEKKYFEMRNGVVYRKMEDSLLFCVPSEMKKSILFKSHDQLYIRVSGSRN